VRISVVICTYALDLFDDLLEAVESVRSQTHDDVEVVVVIDGNEELAAQVRDEYGDTGEVVIHCNDENRGLSASRNNGIELATGDIIAFLDDDAVAREDWLAELVATYEEHDAIAAGGRMAPRWVAGKPAFLPAEFYWLVGVTHRGFAEPGEEVRNTFGSNISFRASVLEALGGFETEMGRKGDANLQAEEPEFCTRMYLEYGRGVVYNPGAVVEHKVFAYRTERRFLLSRAFWQGYSKRGMSVLLPPVDIGAESDYLGDLLFSFAPSRLGAIVRRPTLTKVRQFVWLWLLTAAVGLGYLYGVTQWR
jgi:glycosyltransferase involved in cell wall biosynthesis